MAIFGCFWWFSAGDCWSRRIGRPLIISTAPAVCSRRMRSYVQPRLCMAGSMSLALVSGSLSSSIAQTLVSPAGELLLARGSNRSVHVKHWNTNIPSNRDGPSCFPAQTGHAAVRARPAAARRLFLDEAGEPHEGKREDAGSDEAYRDPLQGFRDVHQLDALPDASKDD